MLLREERAHLEGKNLYRAIKMGVRMASGWRIELFGQLRAMRGDEILSRFRTQKAGSLLAYLAFHLNRSHPCETLIEILWPDVDEKSGRNNLSMALSFLRHPLEPPGERSGSVLLADRATVRLNPACVATDVAEFESLISTGENGDSAAEWDSVWRRRSLYTVAPSCPASMKSGSIPSGTVWRSCLLGASDD